MQCPACRAEIPDGQGRCASCGADLGIWRLIEDLKAQQASLQQASSLMAENTRALGERLDALTRALVPPAPAAPAAAAQAPSPPAAEPGPPVPPMIEAAAPLAAAAPPTEVAPPAEQAAPSAQPPAPAARPSPLPPPLYTQPRRTPPPRPVRPEVEEPARPTGEVAFGQKWLLIGGVIILVLGVAYFLKYAFDQNWIGPAGRVAMAYLAGLACLAVGDTFRRKDLASFGLALVGGGIAILYFSSFAAFQLYELIGQIPAFAMMVLVTGLAGSLAVVYDTRWLAILGLVGGFATPIVLSTGSDNQVGLMTYMAILNAGVLGLAAFKRWNALNFLGFLFTWVLFTGYFGTYYAPEKFWLTTFYLNLFFVAYAVAPFLYYYVRREQMMLRGFLITVPNAFIAFGFSYAMIDEYTSLTWVSVVSLAYSALHLGLASQLYRRDPSNLQPFVLLIAKGLLFLVVTVPLLFSGHWITFFWSAQTVALAWVGLRLENRGLWRGALWLGGLVVLKFFLYDYDELFEVDLDSLRSWSGWSSHATERLLTAASVLGALFGVGHLASRFVDHSPLPRGLASPKALWTVFGVALFFVLHIEVSTWFHTYASGGRFAAISVLWGVFSLGLMVLGFSRTSSVLRRWSIALFGLTALKVMAVDMASVSTPFRIVSFMVLGLLLIGASYLYHRFKDRILPPES